MQKYLLIKARFIENQDFEYAEKMEKYMRNQFRFYGIPSPKRKAIYQDIIKTAKKSKVIDWELLDVCYKDEFREFQYFVTDYLAALLKYLSYDDIIRMKDYLKHKQWWDTIDCFDGIIGYIGLVDSRVDTLMLEWSKDEDIWLRRIAIDHQLDRKSKTNTKLLEEIIVNNFGSTEFFVNKAIGWSLREYSKTNREWVQDFINRYHSQLDNLSIKEGSKYL